MIPWLNWSSLKEPINNNSLMTMMWNCQKLTWVGKKVIGLWRGINSKQLVIYIVSAIIWLNRRDKGFRIWSMEYQFNHLLNCHKWKDLWVGGLMKVLKSTGNSVETIKETKFKLILWSIKQLFQKIPYFAKKLNSKSCDKK